MTILVFTTKVSSLLVFILSICRTESFETLENGIFNKTIGATGCQTEKYYVGFNSLVTVVTAGYENKTHEKNVACNHIYKSTGSCSLLLKCSDFKLQNPREKDDKCTKDFLTVRNKNGYKAKHCGEKTILQSNRNYGNKIALRFRTNKDGITSTGFSCQITCCPEERLTSTVLDVGKETTLPPVQECNPAPGRGICGVKGSLGNIVGGQVTEKNAYTWMAMLTTSGTTKLRTKLRSDVQIPGVPRGHSPFCGGSLISKDWILTAAHCTLLTNGQTSPESFRVVLGEWNRLDPLETNVAVFELSLQLRHPAYSNQNYDNDIALWKLKSPADLSVFRTICLPVPGTRLKNPLTVAGWGLEKEGSTALAPILKEVLVPAVTLQTCQAALDPFQVTANMLCAGGVLGEDACNGDSGGPLMGENVDQVGQIILAGVVSWGIGCAREGLYGVYTKVSNYNQWIMNTTDFNL